MSCISAYTLLPAGSNCLTPGKLFDAAPSGAALSGAALSGAALSGAALSGAALSGAALSGAALSGAFRRVRLLLNYINQTHLYTHPEFSGFVCFVVGK
jgi:hypothetical protein